MTDIMTIITSSPPSSSSTPPSHLTCTPVPRDADEDHKVVRQHVDDQLHPAIRCARARTACSTRLRPRHLGQGWVGLHEDRQGRPGVRRLYDAGTAMGVAQLLSGGAREGDGDEQVDPLERHVALRAGVRIQLPTTANSATLQL